jgi:hypothetical protein
MARRRGKAINNAAHALAQIAGEFTTRGVDFWLEE